MRYEPAAAVPREVGCQPGAAQLARAIGAGFPTLLSRTGAYGCFNRRRIEGSKAWSLHAEGRAIDVGTVERDGHTAWLLACELVGHRTLYGTMRVIYSGHIWTTERRDRWDPLAAALNQHHDHVHVELFRAAAQVAPASYTAQVAALTAAAAG